MKKIADSFTELNARDRAKALLDKGSFRELLGPFERLASPHLVSQGIVPQSDDGVVIARGFIEGKSAVVISIEGTFQGGGIGEVSGAKIAGALELAVHDHEHGIKTRAVVVLDSGGVRLQEANYGLLAISEIQSAVIALRRYIPVVGIIPGKVGCFGGMSMTAALFSTLIVTPEGRLTLNGPEVIEQEAGIAELDSKDKQLIWSTIGGIQRQAVGFADVVVEDDIPEIIKAVHRAFEKRPLKHRSEQVDFYLSRLRAINPEAPLSPMDLRELWNSNKKQSNIDKQKIVQDYHKIDETSSRGAVWLSALTETTDCRSSATPSIISADAKLNGEPVRYITVVPNPTGRFPRARHGEVGLEEGWTIAKYVREAIEEDRGKEIHRAIVAIVDVPSQAYGYKEELLGIFQSCAAAVDAYATARFAGHPIISFLVGPAISGAFLAHGYQANKIIALDDPHVLVHAMSKQSAARITRRSIEELDEAAKTVPAIAYDIRSFGTLGALHEIISGVNADEPNSNDISRVRDCLYSAIELSRLDPADLSSRLSSDQALIGRAASIKVREKLAASWS